MHIDLHDHSENNNFNHINVFLQYSSLSHQQKLHGVRLSLKYLKPAKTSPGLLVFKGPFRGEGGGLIFAD